MVDIGYTILPFEAAQAGDMFQRNIDEIFKKQVHRTSANLAKDECSYKKGIVQNSRVSTYPHFLEFQNFHISTTLEIMNSNIMYVYMLA